VEGAFISHWESSLWGQQNVSLAHVCEFNVTNLSLH